MAQLELQGITGGAFVQIAGGTNEAPRLDAVAEGIPVIDSQPSQLAAVFDAAPRLLDNLITVSDQVARILSPENQRAITEILINIQTLSEALDDAGGDVASTLAEARATFETLNALVTDIRGDVDAIADNANALLVEARQTLEVASFGVEETVEEFGATAE